MPNALFIENLPSHQGKAELELLLKPFGNVRHLTLATDPDMIRRHAGLAVVEMDTPAQAKAAVRGLEGTEYHGGTLRARPALARDVARLNSMCQWTLSIHEHRAGTALRSISWDPRPPGNTRPRRRASVQRRRQS
jgi:RNA recognition motif-containing protein